MSAGAHRSLGFAALLLLALAALGPRRTDRTAALTTLEAPVAAGAGAR